ncbi:hypothetical protein PV410_31870 [Streptomyces sp. PA03-5A]|nr:hypothetical protein [Streptomyces sp. PA03-5A]
MQRPVEIGEQAVQTAFGKAPRAVGDVGLQRCAHLRPHRFDERLPRRAHQLCEEPEHVGRVAEQQPPEFAGLGTRGVEQ